MSDTQRVVLWGARRGDIQLASDEDWERQARLAREHYYRMRMRQVTVTIGLTMRGAIESFRQANEAMRRLSLTFEQVRQAAGTDAPTIERLAQDAAQRRDADAETRVHRD